MGYSTYSDVAHANYSANLLRSRGTTFTHTADIREGRAAAGVHARLNPHGLTVRESRDSDAHPESVAVAVWFDVTGSMGGIPPILQNKLTSLMRLLTEHGYLAHPHVLFGAVGDTHSDSAPLQVGQFEAGIEMDEDLSHIYLEGGGGGGLTGGLPRESYGLAHYTMARHTATDCWEKRQHKGYLFTIGDEAPYLTTQPTELRQLVGSGPQEARSMADLVADVSTRYEVFHLGMVTPTYERFPGVEATWRELLPEGHVLRFRSPNAVSEAIALVIGLCEGRVSAANVEHDLSQVGLAADEVAALIATLAPLAGARGIVLTA